MKRGLKAVRMLACYRAILVLFLIGLAPSAYGKAVVVASEGNGKSIQEAIEESHPGDVILIKKGVYPGGIRIDRPVELRGEKGAVIDGRGRGSVVTIRSEDVTIKGLTIINSGTNLVQEDSCIFVEKNASRVKVESNVFINCTFGVWVNGARNVSIIGNRITGMAHLPSPLRGNGIHLWDADGAIVEGNVITSSRDGIYISVSEDTLLRNNTITNLRYGIHYMYSDRCRVEKTRSMNNRAGLALMFSKNLIVKDNIALNNLQYGILFRDVDKSMIHNNIFALNEMGVFLYNSLRNSIFNNVIAKNDLGVYVWAGSKENRIYNNSLIQNREQVKYLGAYDQEWSYQGLGNYWSDYTGWDIDGDGLGDTPYRPVTIIQRLYWKYPSVKVLMQSPAVHSLKIMEELFPVLRAPGIIDTHPLMEPQNSGMIETIVRWGGSSD